MTESYRAHYLLTSLAVVKNEHVLINRQACVGQSSRRGYSYNLKQDGKLSRQQMQERCGHE